MAESAYAPRGGHAMPPPPLQLTAGAASNSKPVIQRQCTAEQKAWQANYRRSQPDANLPALFPDRDLRPGWVVSNTDRGNFAHEHIQEKYNDWVPEYGVPPGSSHGWGYADMVNAGNVYEIKPQGGDEPALDQARRYVDQANGHATNGVHKLATAPVRGKDLLMRKNIAITNPFTQAQSNDEYALYLNYHTPQAGEILYQFEVENVSATERTKKRKSEKQKETREQQKKEKQQKAVRGIPKMTSFFGQKQDVVASSTSVDVSGTGAETMVATQSPSLLSHSTPQLDSASPAPQSSTSSSSLMPATGQPSSPLPLAHSGPSGSVSTPSQGGSGPLVVQDEDTLMDLGGNDPVATQASTLVPTGGSGPESESESEDEAMDQNDILLMIANNTISEGQIIQWLIGEGYITDQNDPELEAELINLYRLVDRYL